MEGARLDAAPWWLTSLSRLWSITHNVWVSLWEHLQIITMTLSCCYGCGKPILERFLLTVLDKTWHVDCVRCHQAGIHLILSTVPLYCIVLYCTVPLYCTLLYVQRLASDHHWSWIVKKEIVYRSYEHSSKCTSPLTYSIELNGPFPQCRDQLDEKCFFRDGNIFCREDFYR